MSYTLSTAVEGGFNDIVDSTIDALKDEGFGVLCDVDVKSTLKEKLDKEFINYRILGACNPQQAYNGLQDEIELGALLPCNIIVYKKQNEQVVVSAIDPEKLVGITGNQNLDKISREVKDSFQKIIQKL